MNCHSVDHIRISRVCPIVWCLDLIVLGVPNSKQHTNLLPVIFFFVVNVIVFKEKGFDDLPEAIQIVFFGPKLMILSCKFCYVECVGVFVP